MLQIEEEKSSPTKIKVVGVGGGGMNAVNRMIDADLGGVEFMVVNTDEQVLRHSDAEEKIQIGSRTTRGMGAGGDPEIGTKAALEDRDNILQKLKGADMVFITAGMGGGTGTGAAPVIAEVAKELGALTVGVVTLPFAMEGGRRMEFARQGLEALKEKVDTLITIKNDSIFKVIERNTSVDVAFRLVDDILLNAVKGISDLINTAGLVNVDFADVRSIMGETGDAIMGAGEGVGENRITDAVDQAIHNTLLEDTSIQGASALLINVCGGHDMSITDWKEVSELITSQVDPEANIIIGLTLDETLKDRIRVTVLATGFRSGKREEMPRQRKMASGETSHRGAWMNYSEEGQKQEAPEPSRVVSIRNSKLPREGGQEESWYSREAVLPRTDPEIRHGHPGNREIHQEKWDRSSYLDHREERSPQDAYPVREAREADYDEPVMVGNRPYEDGRQPGHRPRPAEQNSGDAYDPEKENLDIPAFLRRKKKNL